MSMFRRLVPHPLEMLETKKLGLAVQAKARVFRERGEIWIDFNVEHPEGIHWNFNNAETRTNTFTKATELWKHSCLEFFLRPDSQLTQYIEWNFGPPNLWDEIRFENIRERKKEFKYNQISILNFDLSDAKSIIQIKIKLNAEVLTKGMKPSFALTCILKDLKSQKPYHFALSHQEQGKANFHCFKDFAGNWS